MRVLINRRRRDEEQGAIAILAVLLATVLLVLSAFTVDFGMAYVTKRQLATAADSASLAAAATYKNEFTQTCSAAALASQTLVRQHAEDAADSMFAANYSTGLATEGNLTDVRCKGTGVEVVYRANGESGSPFGVLAGGDGSITTMGNASAAYPGAIRCAMCFLGPVDAGNADFSVTGGDTHVNGSITAGPNSIWKADTQISVVGTASGSQSNYTPDYTQGPLIPDPYASMVLPLSESGLVIKAGSPCSGGPGVYSANFEFPNGATCTLAPGAYVVKGIWSAKNNSVISGTGVTLYVKKTGMLDFKNGETQNFAAPTGSPAGAPAGWPGGFAIIYDRDNVNDLSIQGNGNVTITGKVYAPSSKIDFNGNSCLLLDKGTIIAQGVVKANGQKACITLTNADNVTAVVAGDLQLTH
ncbi:pilus assembly protein TadG-related protein [Nocardioides sp. P5_C9_2]